MLHRPMLRSSLLFDAQMASFGGHSSKEAPICLPNLRRLTFSTATTTTTTTITIIIVVIMEQFGFVAAFTHNRAAPNFLADDLINLGWLTHSRMHHSLSIYECTLGCLLKKL